MFQEVFHYQTRSRGQTLKWYGTDHEYNFQGNMKKYPEGMKQWGYDADCINYTFNSHGFRCEEFDASRESVVFLGCSFTMGIGLRLEDVWTTHVARHLGLTQYNLGIGGGSMDLAYRLGECWIPQLKPQLVCLFEPAPDRCEILLEGNQTSEYIGPWAEEYQNDRYYKHWISNEENGLINSRKNRLALKQICQELDIKFVSHPVTGTDKYNQMAFQPHVKPARDLSHFGPKIHEQIAEDFLAKIAIE